MFLLLVAWWPYLLAAVAFGTVAARRRSPLVWFSLLTVAINATIMALLAGGTGDSWGPFNFDGARDGAIGGARIAAIVTVNLGALQRVGAAQWVDALRLPRYPTAWLAALTIATVDVGRDALRIRDSQRMIGSWPSGRLARIRAGVAMLPAIMERGVAAARRRREALQLAGLQTGGSFVPVVAIAALAIAGRIALVALPNISLAYVVIFAGGVIFGARIGAVAGGVSMIGTDLILTGLAPASFANVPAMALVGGIGGWMRNLDFGTDSGRMVAAAAGVITTLIFSLVADFGEWLVVPEFRGNLEFLQARVVAGLAFNFVPAIVNGMVFWIAVASIQRSFKQAPARHPS